MANTEEDLSLVLLESNAPVLACSLTLTSDENGWRWLGYRDLGAAGNFSLSAMGSRLSHVSAKS